MKIHEYQAKELLAAAGAAIPARHRRLQSGRGGCRGVRQDRRRRSCSRPRSTPAAAARAASRTAARTSAASSSSPSATTSPRSPRSCSSIRSSPSRPARRARRSPRCWCRQAADIAREIYLGMVLDRAHRRAGADGLRRGRRRHRGGRRHARPRRSSRCRSVPKPGLQPFQARRLAFELGFTGEQVAAGREDHDGPVPRSSSTRIAAWPRSTRWSSRTKGEVLALDAKIDLRRQRPVPPSRHREAARRGRGEPGRAAGRPRRA